MSDFLDRMKDERAELNERLEKLNDFTCTNKFDGLSVKDKGLLLEQSRHMSSYLRTLDVRIDRAEDTPSDINFEAQELLTLCNVIADNAGAMHACLYSEHNKEKNQILIEQGAAIANLAKLITDIIDKIEGVGIRS